MNSVAAYCTHHFAFRSVWFE